MSVEYWIQINFYHKKCPFLFCVPSLKKSRLESVNLLWDLYSIPDIPLVTIFHSEPTIQYLGNMENLKTGITLYMVYF